jgi:hypothetical protein
MKTLATFLLSALVGAVLSSLGLVAFYDFMTARNRNIPTRILNFCWSISARPGL